MVEIRTPAGVDEHHAASAIFGRVWGGDPMPQAALVALTKAESYVAAAFDRDEVVGAICGFVGIVDGEPQLHSHIAAVLPSHRRRHLGAALKWHQRDWCLERGIETVTWTFDPLVRRNGSFNLHTLGAVGAGYVTDLYGTMDDEINRGDPSDRLVARWDLRDPRVERACGGARIVVDGGERLIRTPTDIEQLRRLNADHARALRDETRLAFTEAFDEGLMVTGMTPDYSYVLDRAPA